jgi:hypothetical protein
VVTLFAFVLDVTDEFLMSFALFEELTAFPMETFETRRKQVMIPFPAEMRGVLSEGSQYGSLSLRFPCLFGC